MAVPEVWGSQCHGTLISDAKKAVGSATCPSAQCLWSLAYHTSGIPATAISAELAEAFPYSLKWWGQLVGTLCPGAPVPQGALNRAVLTDNVQDALAQPSSASWAAQVVKHVRSLGLPAPFAHDCTALIDKSSFVAMLLANLMRSGRAYMLPLGQRPPEGPNCARIIPGLHALVRCQSHTFSCP